MTIAESIRKRKHHHQFFGIVYSILYSSPGPPPEAEIQAMYKFEILEIFELELPEIF